VAYGEGVADRIRQASGGPVDAFIDTHGGGYVKLAVDLGVKPSRIDTIIDFAGAEEYGAKTEGNAEAATSVILSRLAMMIADGRIEVPIAKVYPLSQVREAFRDLERQHTLGKIVLVPG
jgi:NADPH:quinone reductase-like Zn-dependent oxidoreductase